MSGVFDIFEAVAGVFGFVVGVTPLEFERGAASMTSHVLLA